VEPRTKIYGDDDPVFAYKADGLISGDLLTGALSRMLGENIGTYAIKLEGLGWSKNYDVNFVGAELTITPKSLMVVADDQTKLYGTELTLGTAAFTAPGLKPWDSITGVTLTSDGAVSTAPAGAYAITPSAAVGTGLSNYSIQYVDGALTVSPVDVPPLANAPTDLFLTEKFIYPHAERLEEKLVNPMDMLTSAGFLITGQVFFYHPLTNVDDDSYNGFQLEEAAYDFIDGQIEPCDPTGKSGKPCKNN
jgi:hypothetical protein